MLLSTDLGHDSTRKDDILILATLLFSSVFSATGITISEPVHCAAYNIDELPAFRAIVENENIIPDSVHYTLNGEPVLQVPRLSTDWPTYMQNYVHHGYSESPAPTDNTILWTAHVTGDFHEFPTPVVVDGIVYYPSDRGTDSLYALDAATGELIWKYSVGITDDAVTVDNGFLYTASDSIFCLDALTGERIWASGEANGTGSTPVAMEGKVYCGISLARLSKISCLAALDGSNIWTTILDNCGTVSCMTVWNQYVFVPTYRNNGAAFIYALDRETGDILWENDDSYKGYWDSSPVVVDSVIYINGVDGIARGIDAVSGNTVWENTVGYTTATPAYHNGRLYFANDDVDSHFYCLDALSGLSIWAVSGNQHGSSGIADGTVFYGDNSNSPDYCRIVAMNCETGAEVWSYSPDSTTWIASSPAITDGVVYMAIHDWNLYAFGTGLKYTYLSDSLNSQIGWNELVATSYYAGEAVASETISYFINSAGIDFAPSLNLELTGYPNPFTVSTSISFSLADAGFTSVGIYDLSGRIVVELMDEALSAGNHTIEWNGCYQSGEPASAGLYFCRIESNGVIETTGLCMLE